MQAILALEDGRIFRGKGYGAKGECYGEVVFNTSITGYQEIFTDPSYAGQIVVLTNPQKSATTAPIPKTTKPRGPYIEGLIVREFSRKSVPTGARSRSPKNIWNNSKSRCSGDIDTRALVRHLRDHGVMRGVISTLETDTEKLVAKARAIPKMDGTDLAKESSHQPHVCVGTGERSHLPEEMVGCQRSTGTLSRRRLRFRHQAEHSAQAARRRLQGDSGSCGNESGRCVSAEARRSVSVEWSGRSRTVYVRGGQHPAAYGESADLWHLPRTSTYGIALGGKTFKLKFGHHGGNHPVKQLNSGKIEITAHNHNFAVDPDSLPQSEVELTHIDLNDKRSKACATGICRCSRAVSPRGVARSA
jgi:carbamoyl-phosphate synthase small subunit